MHKKWFSFATVLLDNRLYAIGGKIIGKNDRLYLNKCEYYDMSLKKWFEMPSMNIKRCCHSGFIYKNWIWVLGGYNRHKKIGTIENFDKNL